MDLKKLAEHYPFIMRLSLAFVFGWFGINEILHPTHWSEHVPLIIANLLPVPILPFVQGHGAVLIFLAVCFLFRFKLRYTGFLAIALLLSIIGALVSMDGFDETVVRDIGLLGLALSIWLYELKSKG